MKPCISVILNNGQILAYFGCVLLFPWSRGPITIIKGKYIYICNGFRIIAPALMQNRSLLTLNLDEKRGRIIIIKGKKYIYYGFRTIAPALMQNRSLLILN